MSLQTGRVPDNGMVGRRLMETISRIPKFDGSKYEAMLNTAMQVRRGVAMRGVWQWVCLCLQDLLMVVYLANLTKTQVVLGERLCKLPS